VHGQCGCVLIRRAKLYFLAVATALAAPAGAWVVYRAVGIFRTQYSDFRPAREAVHSPEVVDTQFSDLSLELASGTVVKGWTLPSTNGASIVFLHGSPGDRRSLLATALALNRAGYGSVLIDAPGHGESTGRANWGDDTVEAFRAAIRHALDEQHVRHVAVAGYSMGSSIAARVAAEDQRVAAVVLLAPFTNLADQLRYQYRHRIPGMSEVAVIATRAAGVPVAQLRSIEAVATIRGRPLMIVAGDRDSAVPVAMPRALLAAATDPKELWIIEGAGHTDMRSVAGAEEFDRRIRTFLDESIFGSPFDSR
jgi:uncharacterized protein